MNVKSVHNAFSIRKIILFLYFQAFFVCCVQKQNDINFSEELFKAVLEKNQQKAEDALKAGADVNYKTETERKARIIIQASTPPHLSKVERVMEIEIIEQGSAPLHLSVLNSDVQMTELLLKYKADPSIRSDSNITPLFYAAMLNHNELMKMLINHNAAADVAEKSSGRTAFLLVSAAINIPMMKLLIDKKADVNVQDLWGLTPLIAAVNSPEAVALLLKHNADMNKGRICKNSYCSNKGETALIAAVRLKAVESVKLLLKKGADPNFESALTYYGQVTALSLALLSRSEESLQIMKLLFEHKANPNVIQGDFPKDPMICLAVRSGTLDQVKLLLENNADVNAVNMNNETPLIIAAERGDENMLKLLLTNGADTKMKNRNGKTVIEIAKEKNNTQILKYLE